MEGAVWAVVASLAYGVGDFSGGYASRRVAAVRVLLLGAPVATVLLLVLALAVDGRAGGGAVGWGLSAGLAGAVGVLVFYAALAAGTMSVLAPVTAVLSAGVPLAVGLLSGERPGALSALGVAAAFTGVVLLGREPGGGRRQPGSGSSRGLLLALVSGLGFGVFFVLLDRAPADAGLWPVVWARVATIAVVVGAALATGRFRLPPAGGTAAWSLLSGILDAIANVAVLLALRAGPLGLNAVVISLYPAATLVLARILLGERLAGLQRVGIGVAALAVLLLTR